MFRYVAFVWNAENPGARDAARAITERLQWRSLQWQSALQQPGIQVFSSGSKPGCAESYALPDNSGVVLGKLFRRTAEDISLPASPHFDAPESQKLLDTQGQHLIDHYWGRYVAFLHDSKSRTTHILRDPTAALPCLTTRHRGVQVFFSSMDTAKALELGPFTVDWDYIAAWPGYQKLELRQTAFKELQQVLAGERVTVARDERESAFLWHPLRIATHRAGGRISRAITDDPIQAAVILRRRTRDVVHAWASTYSSIVHTLSGGLDSSIVLACLRETPTKPALLCVNYHSPGSNTDERSFARLAAERAGVELLERERDPDLSFEPLLRLRASASPINLRYCLENSRTETQLVRERKAQVLFNGEGGDQLFFQSPARFAAGDYLHRRGLLRGLRRQLFVVALDAARIDSLSVWQVLWEALLHTFTRHRWSISVDAGRFQTLMYPEVIEKARRTRRFVHPWFRGLGDVPSGKIWQAYLLSLPTFDYYDPLGSEDGPERISPLMSQPLIELCLQIPTDLHFTGGWDRALARRAFRQDLPRQIVHRRSKGGLEEYSKLILFRNISLVREMLLEGQLVKQRILDRSLLEEVLSARPARRPTSMVELYDYLSVEAWLRNTR